MRESPPSRHREAKCTCHAWVAHLAARRAELHTQDLARSFAKFARTTVFSNLHQVSKVLKLNISITGTHSIKLMWNARGINTLSCESQLTE